MKAESTFLEERFQAHLGLAQKLPGLCGKPP